MRKRIVSKSKKLKEFIYTPSPWKWTVMDYSTIVLHGPDDDKHWVMSVSPCQGCQKTTKRNEDAKLDWEWGICTTPNFNNSKLIQAAPEMFEALKKIKDHIVVKRYDGSYICLVCEGTKKDINIRHKKTCYYNNVLKKVIQ